MTISVAPVVPAPSALAREALSVVGVSKSFGQVRALQDVSLTVNRGEIVALVGDNGAGKSTLVKVISGVIPLDDGEIYLGGRRVTIGSPNAAAACGIRTIFQDLALADNLDVVENLFLGREITRGLGPLRWMDSRAMQARTSAVLNELEIGTIANIRTPVAQLSGGQRQTVAVARATLNNCEIMLLDEPTASMGLREARNVIELVLRLRAHGTAILLITHNMRQVFDVADRIAVLHLGRLSAVYTKNETTPQVVVRTIMGLERLDGSGPAAEVHHHG